MVRKGLPAEGSKAILDAIADANEEMLKQKKQKQKEREKRELNKEIRDFVNNKK